MTGEHRGRLRFNVLGPLEVFSGHHVLTPGAPKLRRVLALLLLRADNIVSTADIIDELWDRTPPRSATTTAQTYVYQLRKFLNNGSDRALVTKPPGYLLNLGPDSLDVRQFHDLVHQGDDFLEKREDPWRASKVFSDALDLWNGPILSNVECGRLLGAHVVHIEELRVRALQARIEADLQLGRERALIAELRELVAVHPLNEWFHARLIEALYRADRRADALQAYQVLRATLKEELGLEPSAYLQRFQRGILNGDSMPGPYRTAQVLDTEAIFLR